MKSAEALPRRVANIINELDFEPINAELMKNYNDDGEIISDNEIRLKDEDSDKRDEAKRNRKRELDEKIDNEDEPSHKKSALEHLRSMKFAKRDPFSDSSYVYLFYYIYLYHCFKHSKTN